MKFKVFVPAEVTIDDGRITGLCWAANKRFNLPRNTPVVAYDLIRQAEIDGVIPTMPRDWLLDENSCAEIDPAAYEQERTG